MKQVSAINGYIAPILNRKSIDHQNRFSLYHLAVVMGVIVMSCSCNKSPSTKTVPLQAEFNTTTVILQQGPPELDSINGHGFGTPIGKSSFIAHAQFDVNYNLTGKIIVTAESGDKFFATINGHAPDIDDKGNITLHFQSNIMGGSGKYAHATGSFLGTAHENVEAPEGNVSWDGNITY